MFRNTDRMQIVLQERNMDLAFTYIRIAFVQVWGTSYSSGIHTSMQDTDDLELQ